MNPTRNKDCPAGGFQPPLHFRRCPKHGRCDEKVEGKRYGVRYHQPSKAHACCMAIALNLRPKGVLQVMFSHRFGTLEDPVYTFLGMTGVNPVWI